MINTDATREMGGEQHGLAPEMAAMDTYEGITQDKFEIFVGDAGQQYADYFSDPQKSIKKFNQGLY